MSAVELPPRPTWSELKQRLDAAGFRPSRRLGQNFLVDDGTCRAIAAAAGIESDDRVLEVGVGPGYLTRHLLEAGARVLGVEIDSRLATVAAELLPTERLELVETDVLAGKHRLAPEVLARLPGAGGEAADSPSADPRERWALVANLPYAISLPLLALVCELPAPPQRITVLVQLEVAERALAQPGEKAFGPATAALGAAYAGRLLFQVSPAVFRPRPKVASAVLQLVRREDAPTPRELQRLGVLSAALFTQRRKRVRHPLAGLLGGAPAADAVLAELGLEPETRVEALTREDLLRLAGRLDAHLPARGGAAGGPGPDPTEGP